MRKVVELARALCAEPKLLLLDEPSSGLNIEETEEMAFWIDDIKNDLGITVFMIEHDMSLVVAPSPTACSRSTTAARWRWHAAGGAEPSRRDPGVSWRLSTR